MVDGSLSRRAVIAIAGAAPLLAACGAEDDDAAPQAAPAVAPDTSALPARPADHRGTSSPASPALVATDAVPVGGAVVLTGQALVVTQPVAGEFHCFSSLCTHAGCPVRAGSPLVCPCHGSEFAITDGSVVRGPATRPLPARKVSVVDGAVHLG